MDWFCMLERVRLFGLFGVAVCISPLVWQCVLLATNTRVAQKLGCEILPSDPVQITVADGRKECSKGYCARVQWLIQEHSFTYNIKLMNLGTGDVILEVDWLLKFSPILFDFKEFPNLAFDSLHFRIGNGYGVIEHAGLKREIEEWDDYIVSVFLAVISSANGDYVVRVCYVTDALCLRGKKEVLHDGMDFDYLGEPDSMIPSERVRMICTDVLPGNHFKKGHRDCKIWVEWVNGFKGGGGSHISVLDGGFVVPLSWVEVATNFRAGGHQFSSVFARMISGDLKLGLALAALFLGLTALLSCVQSVQLCCYFVAYILVVLILSHP